MKSTNKVGSFAGLGYLVLLLMIVTLSWLGSFQTTARGVSPSETTTGSSCAAFAAAEMGKVNRDIAIIGARTSDFFAQESSKFTNVTYNSVFETVHWSGPPTCIPSNELLNIVFAAYNFSRFTGYMVISEDPSTLTPNSVRLQTQSLRFDSCPTGSCFWAGHEVNAAGCIYDPCYGTGPYTIYGATAEFYVSPISYPPTGCRDSYTCAMSSWVGLENSIGAGDRNLAQAGVLGTCQGSFPFGGPCTPYYTAWYEVLPGVQVNCDSPANGGYIVPLAGDDIYVSVTNEQIYGGNSGVSHNYDFVVYDKTVNESCYSPANYSNFLYIPRYAVYVDEVPKICNDFWGDCATLPKFVTTYFFDASLSSGAELQGTANWLPIYMYTSNGWDTSDIIYNCGKTNVSTGPVLGSTGSSFTETWLTSDCASQPL